MKTRGSREQSLQPEKPQSEASFSLGIGPLSLGAARLTAPHRPVRSRMATAKPRANGVRHPTSHRAFTHSSFPSSAAAPQNCRVNGQNFTYGKDLHCFACYCFLMSESLLNTIYLTPAPLRLHRARALHTHSPSQRLTSKRCPVNPPMPHSDIRRREPVVVDQSTGSFARPR